MVGLNGFKRSPNFFGPVDDGVVDDGVVDDEVVEDGKWEAFRACCFTSVGEGIRVLRYLAKGVISCAERERK